MTTQKEPWYIALLSEFNIMNRCRPSEVLKKSGSLYVYIDKVTNLPVNYTVGGHEVYVAARVGTAKGKTRTLERSSCISWNETIDLGIPKCRSQVLIYLKSFDPVGDNKVIGQVSMGLMEFIEGEHHVALLQDGYHFVYDPVTRKPTEIFLSADATKYQLEHEDDHDEEGHDTGSAHSHSRGDDHGHSHGNDHGHSHAAEDHGHSHAGGGHGGHGGHGGKKDGAKKENHGHAHSGDDHGHAHGKKNDHGHAHGEDDHGHAHGESDDHGHAHGESHDHGDEEDTYVDNGHAHKKEHGCDQTDALGHGHSHGDGAADHGHAHGVAEEEKGHAHRGDDHGDEGDHGHSHGDADDHGHGEEGNHEDHGHAHGEGEDHGHAHGDKEDHGHAHGDDDESHGHAHSYDGGEQVDHRAHGHEEQPTKRASVPELFSTLNMFEQPVRVHCLPGEGEPAHGHAHKGDEQDHKHGDEGDHGHSHAGGDHGHGRKKSVSLIAPKSPTILSILSEPGHSSSGVSQSSREKGGKRTTKHVVMLTRGTRGDVQPFVAIAVALAERCGWDITIVTEQRYKDFVLHHGSTCKGKVHFKCSGGDTLIEVDNPLAKWCLADRSPSLPKIMLSRSEEAYLDTEPVAFYWCEKLKPDLVLFGSTMVSIATIISEKLQIPIVGVLFQPTLLQERSVPLDLYSIGFLSALDNKSHHHEQSSEKPASTQERIENWMSINSVLRPVNKIRTQRRLQPLEQKSDPWAYLSSQNVPIIVPVNQECMGSVSLPRNCQTTDFVYLRHRQPELAPRMQKFVDDAAEIRAPLVVLAFNSLPLPRLHVLRIALNLIEQCPCRPHVLALCTASGKDETGAKRGFMMRVDKYKSQGKLFEAQGASYPHLFRKTSVLVCNGGVGTTSEGLLAGVPVLVTGMQIMDQPFWGQRVHELGCGPEPTHISKFHELCVNLVEQAAKPASPWRLRAKALAEQLIQNGGSKAGLNGTVNAIMKLMDKVRPVGADPNLVPPLPAPASVTSEPSPSSTFTLSITKNPPASS